MNKITEENLEGKILNGSYVLDNFTAKTDEGRIKILRMKELEGDEYSVSKIRTGTDGQSWEPLAGKLSDSESRDFYRNECGKYKKEDAHAEPNAIRRNYWGASTIEDLKDVFLPQLAYVSSSLSNLSEQTAQELTDIIWDYATGLKDSLISSKKGLQLILGEMIPQGVKGRAGYINDFLNYIERFRSGKNKRDIPENWEDEDDELGIQISFVKE